MFLSVSSTRALSPTRLFPVVRSYEQAVVYSASKLVDAFGSDDRPVTIDGYNFGSGMRPLAVKSYVSHPCDDLGGSDDGLH